MHNYSRDEVIHALEALNVSYRLPKGRSRELEVFCPIRGGAHRKRPSLKYNLVKHKFHCFACRADDIARTNAGGAGVAQLVMHLTGWSPMATARFVLDHVLANRPSSVRQPDIVEEYKAELAEAARRERQREQQSLVNRQDRLWVVEREFSNLPRTRWTTNSSDTILRGHTIRGSTLEHFDVRLSTATGRRFMIPLVEAGQFRGIASTQYEPWRAGNNWPVTYDPELPEKQPIMYGEITRGTVVIVDDPLKAMQAYQAGVENVCIVPKRWVSGWVLDSIRWCVRGSEHVIAAWDEDTTGVHALERLVDVFDEQARFIHFPHDTTTISGLSDDAVYSAIGNHGPAQDIISKHTPPVDPPEDDEDDDGSFNADDRTQEITPEYVRQIRFFQRRDPREWLDEE